MMRVGDRMTAKPVTISPEETLATARELMKRGKFRSLPVVEGGRLVGILTDRDTRQHEGYFELTKVTAAMKPDPMTVAPESSVLDAAGLLIQHKISGLPVMGEGKLVGIVTTSDLLRGLVDVLRAIEGIFAD
jgi:acetoin utilization protein AcuB